MHLKAGYSRETSPYAPHFRRLAMLITSSGHQALLRNPALSGFLQNSNPTTARDNLLPCNPPLPPSLFPRHTKVLVEDSKTLGPTGGDRVQFVMEANQGQTRGTVDTVASSGEKSRLLLLLETRLPPPQTHLSALHGRGTIIGDGDIEPDIEELEEAAHWPEVDGTGRDVSGGGGVSLNRVAPCAVLYDEIDAHVGGRTAVAVGRLLANQGRDSQVSKGRFLF